jgi:hypothetical protein
VNAPIFLFGAVLGAVLMYVCMRYRQVTHDARRAVQPSPLSERDWKIVISNMTRSKALGLVNEKPGNHIQGFVISREGSQAVALVYQSGVRWLEPGDMWEVMHPTDPKVATLLAQSHAANVQHLATPVPFDVAPLDHFAAILEENSPEHYNQLRFDFTKIRSVSDTIEDLKELIDLTTWQQDCVGRAAIWLSGLSDVNDAWWQQFIKYVDTLTTQPEHEQTRESLIELVSRVVAHPADAL